MIEVIQIIQKLTIEIVMMRRARSEPLNFSACNCR